MTTVLNYRDFIDADGEKLTTDSLRVALVHKKRHDNVVALIRKRLSESGPWGLLNFKEINYVDDSGRKYPMFTMTQAGYQFLVGKMTGAKAVEHQIAFIEAFGAMQAYLENQQKGLRFQIFECERKKTISESLGSYHGKGLNQRKQEKPVIDTEYARLLDKAQPGLFAN